MLRVLVLLLLAASTPVFAQESGDVIATADETGFLINTHQFVWLDNERLIFELPRNPGAVSAYEYRVSASEVERLAVSPLYFEPTPKRVEHYQIETSEPNFSYNSFRSPFTFSSSLEYPLHNIIYLSSLYTACGFECPHAIIMAGVHDDQPDYTVAELYEQTEIEPLDYIVSRTYHALSVRGSYSLGVHWTRTSSAAVVEIANLIGAGARLYYTNLVNNHFGVYAPEVYIGSVYSELGTHLYALSDDGTRVIYGAFQPEEVSRESLQVWQIIPASSDAIWSAEVLPTIEIAPESSVQDAFAGANFIPDDETHIIALHADGILRINLSTGEREVLNPDINAQRFRLGVFSPDNRHIAVVAESGEVRVLPTGIQ